MAKVRIHEIAKELGIKSKEVVEKAKELNFEIKAPSSGVSAEDAEKLVNYIMSGAVKPAAQKTPAPAKKPEPKKEVKSAPVAPKAEQKEPAKETVAKTTEPKKEEKAAPQKQEKALFNRRRKGLTIKKKRREPEIKIERRDYKKEARENAFKKAQREAQEASDKALDMNASSYGKLSQETLEEIANRSKGAKKPTSPAKKKEHGNKLNILESRDFGNMADTVAEEEEVVLLDFREQELKKERDELEAAPAKKKQTNQQRRPSGGFQNRSLKKVRKKKRYKKDDDKVEVVTSIEIPEEIRVYEFAEKVNKTTGEVIKVLFTLGMLVTKNDFLDKDAIEILAEEFEVEVNTVDATESFDYVTKYEDRYDAPEEKRAPIITIMGHVDHGKTSLLDKIRNSKVADKEAGGITQHVGAYSVRQNGELITFVDTPGHAAFTEMRARGASVTDIVIIVVAADDGVKPQTEEALSHAKAAGVPILIAVNKIDKPAANVDMVKGQLAELGFSPVDWGGDYEFIEVSAKTGDGIDDLLETILLQAELLELTAQSKCPAKATVVESALEKGRGPVATVIINNGTLSVGDNIVVGAAHGRVRALLSDLGKSIKKIGPSETGVVVGLNEVPTSGEIMIATDSDKEAKELAEKRRLYDRQKELSVSTKATLDELSSMIAEGNLKALKVILKADVNGSLEAIKGSLAKLRNEEVKITVVHSGVGGITESDVTLAGSSENCVILGFNVRPTGSVKANAKKEGVDIKTYSVIYEMIDDLTAILQGMMSKEVTEENTGQAEVRDTFVVPKIGTVAGCFVSDGKVVRGGKARLIRDGVVMHVTTINSLKRFKDDVKEVGKGYECGIMLEGYNDIQKGDFIETFIEKEVEKSL